MRLSAQHLLEAVKWLAIFSSQPLGVCIEEEGGKEGRKERRKERREGGREEQKEGRLKERETDKVRKAFTDTSEIYSQCSQGSP